MITILNSTALQVVDINKLSTDNTLFEATALQTVDINKLSIDNTLMESTALTTAPYAERSGETFEIVKPKYTIIIT